MGVGNVDEALVLYLVIILFSVLFSTYYSHTHAFIHVLPHAYIFLPTIPRSLSNAHSCYVKESNWKKCAKRLGDNECQQRKKNIFKRWTEYFSEFLNKK